MSIRFSCKHQLSPAFMETWQTQETCHPPFHKSTGSFCQGLPFSIAVVFAAPQQGSRNLLRTYRCNTTKLFQWASHFYFPIQASTLLLKFLPYSKSNVYLYSWGLFVCFGFGLFYVLTLFLGRHAKNPIEEYCITCTCVHHKGKGQRLMSRVFSQSLLQPQFWEISLTELAELSTHSARLARQQTL